MSRPRATFSAVMNVRTLAKAVQIAAPGAPAVRSSSTSAPRNSSRNRKPTLVDGITPCINCWFAHQNASTRWAEPRSGRRGTAMAIGDQVMHNSRPLTGPHCSQ